MIHIPVFVPPVPKPIRSPHDTRNRIYNEIYAEFFADQPPARACVEVARLPRDVGVEVEAVALTGR